MAGFTVDSVVPDLTTLDFTQGVYLGYALTNDLMESHEFFKSIPGKEAYPILRRAAVEFSVARYVENQMPWLTFSFVHNKAANCRHLEIRNGNLIVTINAVNGINEFPRDAVFRMGLQQNNQLTIDDLFVEVDQSTQVLSILPVYLTVTYGKRDSRTDFPNFVRIGLPFADRREFFDVIDLATSSDILSASSIDEQLPTLKEQFIKSSEARSMQYETF